MSSTVRREWRFLSPYLLMLGAACVVFAIIRHVGEGLPPPVTPTEAAARPPGAPAVLDPVPHVLLALAAVILLGRAIAALFVRLGQPPVIGEVVAGIALGPSLLGRLSPAAAHFVLPASVAPFLGLIAQLGVILYMFLVGLELNPGRLRRHAHATVAISHASIVLPFLLGAGLSLALYVRFAPAGVPFTSFALFMGVAMSITAFPVLARILTDRKETRTELGTLALACAATDDVTAWCLLAFVVGVARAEITGALLVAGLALAFLLLMFFVVRPIAGWLARRFGDDEVTGSVAAWVFVALLLSSLATEAIGIHAIFGAFLLGAIIPHDSGIARVFARKLNDVVCLLLLPAFFAYTGMRTQIGLVAGLENWLWCAAIIFVATAGKFGGTLAAARVTGLDWHTSASLGVLMNTRGLMELIVLNVGLDLGAISPTLFAMMVLMALVTTLMTTPILTWMQRLPQDRDGPRSLDKQQPESLVCG